LRGAWSRDDGGRRVAVGGADRMVCIWEVESGNISYKVCRAFLLFASYEDVSLTRGSLSSYLVTKAQ
jgi:hypothetical protein